MPSFLTFYYLCHINPHKIMEMLRYFYHPDHASASLSNLWITDNTGEDWVDQRNSSWNAPYTFSGKEKDVETGYGYVKKLRFFSSLAFGNEKQVFHYAHCLRRFGARYYDSGLSIWLSVDPMSDKYPSMSPYNYCANNPVILVDPDGREVEYNSLIDHIIVGVMRLTNSNFDKRFKELEASSETYAFKYNNKGESTFNYDGKKLNINYSITSGLRSNGDNIFSVLNHETEHAMQFEHGEIGFEKNTENNKWYLVNEDIYDELRATDVGFSEGSVSNAQSVRGQWGNKGTSVETMEQKINWLKEIPDYKDLPNEDKINRHSNKVKSDTEYRMPFSSRNF